jgi:hypothetical protein
MHIAIPPVDESFDAIVDKGTIDCVLCGEHAAAAAAGMLSEAWRVLKPGGHYVGISYGTPKSRMPLFTQQPGCAWIIKHYSLSKPINSTPAGQADNGDQSGDEASDDDDDEDGKFHHVYMCRKV